MHRLVRAEVERARQVARVKGLNRKLHVVSRAGGRRWRQAGYPATMAALVHRKCWRDEVKFGPREARPASAI